MSKRALKKYLKSLDKEQLEEQILDLYQRFDDVRIFYNFVFNPREEKLVQEAKLKISKEYFPPNKRKAKARRSIAQKQIKQFLKLGVDPYATADVMLYNIEIAQTFSADRKNLNEAFYKSILKSFEEAINFIHQKGITGEFGKRIQKITAKTENQYWHNAYKFERLSEEFFEKLL